MILADDMGYGDVQALNPESKIPTPHLDRLAAEGMTFTDAHTPSAVCTPTRYGLLTGRYCWRSRLKSGVLNGYSPPLIEADRPTIASVLGDAGYTCGVIGKWHLGLGFARRGAKGFDFGRPVADHPGTRGFDASYVIPASLDFPPYVYINKDKITKLPLVAQEAQKFPAFLRKGERSPALDMESCLPHLAAKAAQFIEIEAALQKPFLLYFPLTAPHKPVLPHPRFQGRTGLGPYGDFIAQIDWTVGHILATIDKAGVADSTMVIYTSDNGSFMHHLRDKSQPDHVSDETVQAYLAANHRANHVFRGTKADIWEAGHRVPFFIRWPGHVEPGSRCGETICLTDLFATLATVAGAATPAGAAEDSYSFLPLLEGKTRDDLPRDERRPPVIHHSAAGMFAIRAGRWKLVLGNGSGGREAPGGKPFGKPYQLFDLEADIGEEKNVAAEHPDIVKRLEQACAEIRGE